LTSCGTVAPHLGNYAKQLGANMKPHHKPKNVALSKITRLRTPQKGMPFVRDTQADLTIRGQHLGFEVSQAALMRIRGGFV
jgi:hypothetical protein